MFRVIGSMFLEEGRGVVLRVKKQAIKQVTMPARITRLKLPGPAKGGERIVQLAPVLQDIAKAVVSFRVLGIPLQQAPIACLGFVKPILLVEEIAQVVERPHGWVVAVMFVDNRRPPRPGAPGL